MYPSMCGDVRSTDVNVRWRAQCEWAFSLRPLHWHASVCALTRCWC